MPRTPPSFNPERRDGTVAISGTYPGVMQDEDLASECL